jgi:hypothetical protein
MNYGEPERGEDRGPIPGLAVVRIRKNLVLICPKVSFKVHPGNLQ